MKGKSVLFVPSLFVIELGGPEVCVGVGNRRILATCVAMPGSSVHEYSHFVFGQANVGRARKISPMKAKSKSAPVKYAPCDHFRLCIFAFDF